MSTTWTIDAAHSDIHFKVRHLMITNVTGTFSQYQAAMKTNDDGNVTEATFSADINSISTGQEARDNHLKSDDFFNAEAYPQLTFSSKEIKQNGDSLEIHGEMTIRDVTQPLVLTGEFLGEATDPWGQVKRGFELKGKISRKAFNLKWDAITEKGAVVVSDEVRLELNVQMIPQQS